MEDVYDWDGMLISSSQPVKVKQYKVTYLEEIDEWMVERSEK